MKTKKSNHLENYLSFFAWFSGMLVSIVVGYAVLAGPIQLPEILGNHLFSNIIGWAIIITTIVTIVLSFFRK
jgi:amino acid transporter